jgi:hypothetical protein
MEIGSNQQLAGLNLLANSVQENLAICAMALPQGVNCPLSRRLNSPYNRLAIAVMRQSRRGLQFKQNSI